MKNFKERMREFFWETEHKQNHTVLLITILFSILIISLISPNFFTYRNFASILEQMALYLVMALGMTFIMITGGIDVSVGSVLGVVVAFIGIAFSVWGLPIWITIILALVIGTAAGAGNGLLITKVKLPPIIATIATLNIYRGLAYMMIGDNIYYRFPRAFRALATTKILQIPSSVYISLIFAVLCYMFLKYHYTGRHSIAVGANPMAARLAGIRADSTIIKIYGLAGFLFGIAGIIMTAKLNSSQAVAGTGIELHIIAVTVIGGTSLAGGYGTILGTVMGTILIAILENSLIIMNVSYFWQKFVLGLMIVVAVAFRTLRQERKVKGKQGR